MFVFALVRERPFFSRDWERRRAHEIHLPLLLPFLMSHAHLTSSLHPSTTPPPLILRSFAPKTKKIPFPSKNLIPSHSYTQMKQAGALPRPPSIRINPIQRLEHDHSIPADHTHSQADFLVVGFALGGFVEDDVEEDVVAAQRAHDFARAVELHFDALVEVLFLGEKWLVFFLVSLGGMGGQEGLIREVGVVVGLPF